LQEKILDKDDLQNEWLLTFKNSMIYASFLDPALDVTTRHNFL